jgi:dTMP kinase
LLLDLPVPVGLLRAGNRSAPDRFEREAEQFFERVRRVYLERAAREPKRFRVIDTSKSPDEVKAALAAVLGEFVGG